MAWREGAVSGLVLIALAACPAVAVPLTWSFQGTLEDGSVHAGTFVYNPETNKLLSWDLGSYFGGFAGGTFNSSLNDPNGLFSSSADTGADIHSGWDLNFHYTQYDPIEISPGDYEPGWDYLTLQLDLPKLLTDTGGTLPLIPGGAVYGSFFYVSNDSGGGSQFAFLSGSVTEIGAATPEPQFLPLLDAFWLGVQRWCSHAESGMCGISYPPATPEAANRCQVLRKRNTPKGTLRAVQWPAASMLSRAIYSQISSRSEFAIRAENIHA
ncbi:MAG TPA: hypothetical protein VH351_09985 [Bryobacteraceae bacterium]|jgi:hypothetical protein|nr:hypothetical protein [Bryobacteraceae bacterium]